MIINPRLIGCLKVIYELDKSISNFIKARRLSGLHDIKIDSLRGQTFLTVLELNVKVFFKIEVFIPGSSIVTNSPLLFESL